MRRIWGATGGGNLSLSSLTNRSGDSSTPITPTTPSDNLSANGKLRPTPSPTTVSTTRSEDYFDDMPLPFSTAATEVYKNAYMSPDVASLPSFAPNPAQLLVSPARSAGRRSGRESSLSNASTPAETKEELLLELQSGQAMTEAQEFEILSWSTVEDLKQEHKGLVARLNAMTHKLALETKMRDAALSLKQYNARSAAHHPNGHPLERNASIASNDERIAATQARVEQLSTELYALKQRETGIRTRLLRHTSAVLAATLRKRDHPDVPASHRSSLTVPDQSTPSLDKRTSVVRFDGAHFFANNKEAALPAHSSPSPGANPAFPSIDPTEHAALRAEVEEGTAKAAALTAEVEAHAAAAERARAESSSLQRDLATAQRAAADAERELRDLREDLAGTRAEGDRTTNRLQSQLDGQRAALNATLRRHRTASHPLSSLLPLDLSSNDDPASAFETFVNAAVAHVATLASARDGVSSDLAKARADVEAARRQAEEGERASSALQDLWRVVPSSSTGLDMATADPAAINRAYKPLPRAYAATGDPGFSIPALSERVKGVVSDVRSLAERIEREAGEGKRKAGEVEGAQRALADAQRMATAAQSQVRDLEARAEAAAGQEVASLERLNELQAGFETTRLEKRKAETDRDAALERLRAAEANAKTLQGQVEEAQKRTSDAERSSAPLREEKERLEAETAELQEKLQDAQDDLDDIKGRESKQRVALLDELNTAHAEISTLRTQLRAEQRKRGGK